MKALSASFGLILEVTRILLIFGLLGAIFSAVVSKAYGIIGVELTKTGWWSSVGILVLIFVLYRNYIQFSGWYNGKGKGKLPTKVTRLFVSSSVVLILLPGLIELVQKFI
ncbi:hypothetical protein [Bacillus sp. AFS002410]|uniref:hypothetical protein n=1 Tax=Bacillus sp. AFS002410 TaxID=2033481 RepID=UPI0015CF2F0F|nr:hypothetical protein [Bacillus sp. AFS002410]